ncbi:uncharacterized protein [Aristolochia californica]|uniref:uncharacterized protein n=1 Tax=Aristolochia californica TaxID=171875 RepID=UPI0035D696F2
MGGVLGRGSTRRGENCRLLKQRIKLLEEEIVGTRCKSEQENRVYEQHAIAFIAKEAERKREKKKWKEEVGRLKKKLEEKEERIRRLEEEILAMPVEGKKSNNELQNFNANFLVEQMKEEQALREEAVEKWKRLYLAIKTELDDLILKTRQGERLRWGAEEDLINKLYRQLKAKEEMAEALTVRLADIEKEAARREREMDILRQSLRIMSNSKQARGNKALPRTLLLLKK